MKAPLPSGLEARVAELFPGSTVTSCEAVGADAVDDATAKGFGYGRPLRIGLRLVNGAARAVVFHLAQANDYGHDRRADRAAEQLLAWDTFNLLPSHARALDVGAVRPDGTLLPFPDAGELYLLTDWLEGEVYATDLRRVAESGCSALDLARADGLADYLVALHRQPGTRAPAYARAWRDLVGSGEGIAGIVDGYGAGAPGAPRERLDAIERRCLDWRHRFKTRTGRLRRTHGDYHPFNIVFAPGATAPLLLDTSRGSEGDPADDVACLSINYLFFGLQHRARWPDGLGALWRRFFERYLRDGDRNVLETAPPFFAWRALVLSNPAWYPHLAAQDRDRLLSFAERALAAERFEPAMGEEAMR